MTYSTDFDSVGRVSYLMNLQQQVMSLDFSSDVIKALLEYKKPTKPIEPPRVWSNITEHQPIYKSIDESDFSQIIDNLSLLCGIQKTDKPVDLFYRLHVEPLSGDLRIEQHVTQLKAAAYKNLYDIISDVIREIESNANVAMRRSEVSSMECSITRIANDVAKFTRRGRANRVLVNRQFMIDHKLQIPHTELIHEFKLDQYNYIKFLYHSSAQNYATAFYHGDNVFDRAPQLCIHQKYVKDKQMCPNFFEPLTRYIVRYNLVTTLISDYFVSIT